jgi:hypothetical protein
MIMDLSLEDLRLLRRAVQIAAEDGSLFSGFEDSEKQETAREKQIDDICARLDRAIHDVKRLRDAA